MKENAVIDYNQLLSPTESARAKGMKLNKFKYHVAKQGGPKPVYIGKHRHVYYLEADVLSWRPTLQPQKGNKR